MPSPQKPTLLALLLVACVASLYVASIRDGHVWGDDHAAYLAHARNIVEGKPYGEIGYVRSPSGINPLSYPPVFPLLLAPLYYWFGLNLVSMKILCIVSFCLALLCFYGLMRSAGEYFALGACAVVGFCPYFWNFKDVLYSDYPFLAFAYSALWCASRSVDLADRRRLWHGLVAGGLVGLAYGCRSVGVILVPVILGVDFYRRRRIDGFMMVFTLSSIVFSLVPQWCFHVQSDYSTSYLRTFSWYELACSPFYYLKCFSVVWDNGLSAWLGLAVVGLSGLFVLKGLIHRCRSFFGLGEVFFVVYFGFICLFPWGGRRYLIPILPFYVFYLLVGWSLVWIRLPTTARRTIHALGVLVIVGSFVARYSTLEWHRVAGETDPDAIALIKFLRGQSQHPQLVIFRKPRWMGLLSRSKAGDIFEGRDFRSESEYYDSIGADVFVVSNVFRDSQEERLQQWVRFNEDRLIERFANASFKVYEMR